MKGGGKEGGVWGKERVVWTLANILVLSGCSGVWSWLIRRRCSCSKPSKCSYGIDPWPTVRTR